MLRELREIWTDALRTPGFFVRLVFTALAMTMTFWAYTEALEVFEQRPGVVLNDPVLARFAPLDLSWLSFFIIYGSILIAVTSLFFSPNRLIVAVQTYTGMMILRMIALWVIPLDPPPTVIPLVDPFVGLFTNGGEPLERDLFFSGHTATMSILYFTSIRPRIRLLFLCSIFLVAACVLLQHVHYSIDVVAAPFFAYGSFRIVGWANAGIVRVSARVAGLHDPAVVSANIQEVTGDLMRREAKNVDESF